MAELSIVIVSWNVADMLAACLSSLEATCDGWWESTEVIVVDNASTDGSAEMVRSRFPGVRLISLQKNLGFAGGNNAGIRAAGGELVFLLNPDAVAHPGSIAALAGYMRENPTVGIAGPRLLNPDGSLQPSRRRFPTLATALIESTPLQQWFPNTAPLRRYYMLDRADDETQDVGWLSGAALMCRREALQQSGLFDPGYFMFSEELDLCRRVNDAGWRVVYVPSALITHYGGQSTGQDVPRRHINFNTSKARYFRVREGPVYGWIVRRYLLAVYLAQIVSEAAKWLVGHKRPLRAERLRLYARVLRSGLGEKERRGERGADVLLVTGEYPPDRGGVGDYTCRLRLALCGAAIDARVLTRNRGAAAPKAATMAATPGTERARLKSRARGGIPLRPRRITLRSTLRALRGTRARIAHIQYQTGAYDMRPIANALPLLLRWRWGGPTLVTFHDLRVPYLFPKAGPVREMANRLMARAASAAIATNPEDAARLRSWGVERVQLIPIGSNIPKRPPSDYDRDVWRAARGVGPGTTLLAYFGFLNSTKGLDDLLNALASLKSRGDFRLVMVGGGLGSSDPTNRATAAALDDIARRLGVSEEVIWTGYLSPREVSAALLAADMAVLPYSDGASFRRGSLLAAVEHGLPIVTTRPGEQTASLEDDWPRFVDGVNALLVAPGDPAGLEEAIVRLAGDRELRARLADASAHLARFFGWERIAEMHASLYADLAPRR